MRRVVHVAAEEDIGIHKRGNTFHFRFSQNGRQVRGSLHTSDPEEARRRYRLERQRVHADPSENLVHTIGRHIQEEVEAGNLAPRYAAEVRARLYTLLDFHKNITRLDDFTPKRLQEYLDHVRKRRSAATLSTYAGQLRGLFRLLLERRRIMYNPMDEVRLPAFNQSEHARDNVVAPEKVRELLDKCTDLQLKFILLAGFCLGMRRNEITEARWGWFNLPARVCLIPPEARKRGKPACPPLNSEVIAHLQKMREALPKAPLPTDYLVEPGKMQGANRYRYDFIKPFRRHLKSCGVNCSAHDMRRTYATLAVRSGATLEQLSAWVGDTPRVLAAHYAHLKSYNPLVEGMVR